MRRVHKDMFGQVWEWAGRYRQESLNIGVAPHRIMEEIGRLIRDVEYWKINNIPPVVIAVKIHHRLAWIHPFTNGNGRHARLMGDLFLRRHGRSLPVWPDGLDVEGTVRDHYIAALKQADEGDLTVLENFFNQLTFWK